MPLISIPAPRAAFQFPWNACLLGLYLVLVFLPLLPIVLEALNNLTGEAVVLAIPWGRRFWLLLHSLALSGAVALGGMFFGFLAGTWLWQYQTGLVGKLRWFFLALALLPPYINALVWMDLGSTLTNLWPTLRGVFLVPGYFSCWWVQLLAFFPLALGLSLIGLESLDLTLVEAARLYFSDMKVLLRVVLPLSAPYLLSGGALGFLLSLLDYSVPSLFGINVYTLEIFAEYSASHRVSQAFFLALPLLLLTITLMLAGQQLFRQMLQRGASRSHQLWIIPPRWPFWFKVLQGVALGVLALQILVPLLTLGAWVSSPTHLISTWKKAAGEIYYTFGSALITALITLPLALGVSQKLFALPRWQRGWWLLVILPLAVPPPMVGIGLISLSGYFPWSCFYGSAAMPVLATLARFIPLGALVLLAQWRQVDPLLLDAAVLLETHPWQTWRQIKLPLLAPGCLAAASLVLALSAGELGAVLLVVPPGRSTLTITIYNYLHYGATAAVGGLGLLMAAVTLLAGCFTVGGIMGWSNLMLVRTTHNRMAGDSGKAGQ
jgi:iron(III) transport system permease protein